MSSRQSALTQPARGCCSRFIWEFKGVSFFGLNEPDGSLIDVQRSFAPTGWFPLILRLVFFTMSVATLAYNLATYPELFIYFGYLTHWTFAMAIFYQFLALCLTGCCKNVPPFKDSGPGLLVKLVWILYSIAAPGEVVVILLYWMLDYTGQDLDYMNLYKHGILGLLILFDGAIFVTVIPVRLKHLLFFEFYAISYCSWSYLHSYFGIGNGSFEGDTLYSALDWENDSNSALALSAFIVFVVVPVCYLAIWGISLIGSRRRTLEKQDEYSEMTSSV